MQKSALFVPAVILTTAFAVAPAMAQNVCLQLNRVFSTKVIDNQTLVATDMQHRPYTIHMANRCVNLNQFSQNLSFRRIAGIGSEYLCIEHGDTLGYSAPGDPTQGIGSITVHGAQTQFQCTIDSVSTGAPPPHP